MTEREEEVASALPAELDSLPRRRGFRLRGMQMTRLETFTDAAFAFAVSMLVIAAQQIPDNIASLLAAFRNVPTFVSSIAVLGIFWWGHWLWSRRYGLEDGASIIISWGMIVTILIFIYPLKAIFGAMWFLLSDGRVGQPLALHTTEPTSPAAFCALRARYYCRFRRGPAAESPCLAIARVVTTKCTRKADDACGTNGLEHSGERGDCIAGVVFEFADRKNRMEWLGLFLHGDSGTAAQVLLQPST
jgi:hypothetical protein